MHMLRFLNLDTLVTIYKNWPKDAWLEDATCSNNVDDFFKDKAYLCDKVEEELDEACLFEKNVEQSTTCFVNTHSDRHLEGIV